MEKWPEFWETAHILKHDKERLLRGEEVIQFLRLESLSRARECLSRADAERRKKRAKILGAANGGRSRLGQGMHDRGEAIVFAEGAMLESDVHGLNRHLPIRVKTISILEKRIARNECWDVSTSGTDWGVDPNEELYCMVNVGRLIVESGGCMMVRGNVFSMVCQQLVLPDPCDTYTIGILPTSSPFHLPYGRFDGVAGENGKDGAPGPQPPQVPITSTLFGRFHTGSMRGQIDGYDGKDGERGQNGAHGFTGGFCKLAEINIRDIPAYPPIILAKTGDGGNGGDGGRGGDGGSGSPGRPAYRTLTEDFPSGEDGADGAGGEGGRGGNGGNGGIASDIFICVPPEQENRLRVIALPGKGGIPGKGGQGGRGGIPGWDGRSGMMGRDRPAPRVLINEIPLF